MPAPFSTASTRFGIDSASWGEAGLRVPKVRPDPHALGGSLVGLHLYVLHEFFSINSFIASFSSARFETMWPIRVFSSSTARYRAISLTAA